MFKNLTEADVAELLFQFRVKGLSENDAYEAIHAIDCSMNEK